MWVNLRWLLAIFKLTSHLRQRNSSWPDLSVPAFLDFWPTSFLSPVSYTSSYWASYKAISCLYALTYAIPSAQNAILSPSLRGLAGKSHVTSSRRPSPSFPSEPQPPLLGFCSTQVYYSHGVIVPYDNWGLLFLPPPLEYEFIEAKDCVLILFFVSLDTKTAW